MEFLTWLFRAVWHPIAGHPARMQHWWEGDHVCECGALNGRIC